MAVGDFNHDGKLDIAAGSVYYAAPDWKMVSILEKPAEFDPHNYSESFCNFAEDINGDGRTDLIVVDFPGKQTWWFEQPEKAGTPWKRHECTPVTNNESPSFLDVDGDGKRELLLGYDPGKFIGYAKPSADGLVEAESRFRPPNAPGTDRFSHGIGAGDVNGDGRTDILVIEGWWEAPAEKTQSPWVFHPAKFGAALLADVRLRFRRRRRQRRALDQRPSDRHVVARANARRLEDARDQQRHFADALA